MELRPAADAPTSLTKLQNKASLQMPLCALLSCPQTALLSFLLCPAPDEMGKTGYKAESSAQGKGLLYYLSTICVELLGIFTFVLTNRR